VVIGIKDHRQIGAFARWDKVAYRLLVPLITLSEWGTDVVRVPLAVRKQVPRRRDADGEPLSEEKPELPWQ
jgi:hypothetical protein